MSILEVLMNCLFIIVMTFAICIWSAVLWWTVFKPILKFFKKIRKKNKKKKNLIETPSSDGFLDEYQKASTELTLALCELIERMANKCHDDKTHQNKINP